VKAARADRGTELLEAPVFARRDTASDTAGRLAISLYSSKIAHSFNFRQKERGQDEQDMYVISWQPLKPYWTRQGPTCLIDYYLFL